MDIITDTGTITVRRGRGRPPGPNIQQDTGPLLNLHLLLIENPDWKFGRAARVVGPTINNADYLSDTGSMIRRLRRYYPVWLDEYWPEYLSQD